MKKLFASLVLTAALVVSSGALAAGSISTTTTSVASGGSFYAATPTLEAVTVKSQTGSSFVLAWTTAGLNNPADAVSSTGTISFQETNAGLINTDWSSTPPPGNFPVLCPQVLNCGNALS